MNTHRPHHRRQPKGFTLLEIMFSILIMGVGMVAVASLFPFATQIQQETIADIEAQQLNYNVKNLIVAKGFDETILNNAGSYNAANYVAGQYNQLNRTVLDNMCPIEDRSYPTSIAHPDDRRFYWEPLFRQNGGNWEVLVVVMKRNAPAGATMPDYLMQQSNSFTLRAAGNANDHQYEGGRWIDGSVAHLRNLRVGDTVWRARNNGNEGVTGPHVVLDKHYDQIGQDGDPYSVKLSKDPDDNDDLTNATAPIAIWHATRTNDRYEARILGSIKFGDEVVRP